MYSSRGSLYSSSGRQGWGIRTRRKINQGKRMRDVGAVTFRYDENISDKVIFE